MKQIFFGNSRVILFNPNDGSSPQPPAPERDYAKTRVWLSNEESNWTDYLIEGEFTADKCTAAGFDINDVVKIEFGTSVTSIGSASFFGCSNLTDVIIPNTVTNIGNQAFKQCGNLVNVTIPDSVRQIGTYAFYNCGNLTAVTIGNNVRTIGDYAFAHNPKLKSIKINSLPYYDDEYSKGEFTFGTAVFEQISDGTTIELENFDFAADIQNGYGSFENFAFLGDTKPGASVTVKASDGEHLVDFFLETHAGDDDDEEIRETYWVVIR